MSSPRYHFAALQSQGMRDYQEDEFGILDGRSSACSEDEHTLLVVADGMGGHSAGATASELVTKSFIDSYQHSKGSISERLELALTQSNACIADEAAGNKDRSGMGTTVLAAVVSTAGLEWISVGDSPLWLFRNAGLQRINADHSMAPVLAEMVAAGRMTASEAAADSNRNALRAAVTGESLDLIDLSMAPLALSSGDILLLASDGVMTLGDEEIAKIVEKNLSKGSEAIAAHIMRAVTAEQRPNQDNVTIVVYSVDPNIDKQDKDTFVPTSSLQD